MHGQSPRPRPNFRAHDETPGTACGLICGATTHFLFPSPGYTVNYMTAEEAMGDPINTLRGLCDESRARDEELRAGFKQLESRLAEASAGLQISGRSDNCSLERYGDDEATYGYLYFEDAGLRVAYRSTENDLVESWNDSSDPTFSIQSLDKCKPVWLRALASPPLMQSLIYSITEAVRASVAANYEAVHVLAATVNLPTRSLESAFVDAAEKLNFGVVLQDWRDAQSALGIDAADAATRACRLLETLCKHVLQTQNQPMPADQTIQKLFKPAVRSLKLSPDQQSSEDLRAVASGMFSAVQGIGALRTHAGTAHGSTADRYEITFSEARLAVNSAGVLATFMMETLLASSHST